MSKTTRSLPYAFFILSGACSLVYEVAWARYLGLFLGNTTLAHMCILAGFMGGLALGSLAVGHLVRSIKRPLAVYGLLEAFIGLYAVAYPYLIHLVESKTLGAASGLEIGSAAWIGLKLAVSASVLLAPTILMGGTFPLLVKHCQSRPANDDGKVEWLYAANCSGAVAGSLLAGFLLLPVVGLRATLTIVGTANVLLGVTALAFGILAFAKSKPDHDSSSAIDTSSSKPLWPIYITIGISGAAAMVYELVWIRVFAVVLGSSTYSFTLMVAAFITGIALGSMAVGRLRWLWTRPLLAFAIAEFGIGLVITLSMPLYERLPWVFWMWSASFVRTASTVWLHNTLHYLLCFCVMAVPTFLFGITLPLAIRATGRTDDVSRNAGYVYGANTTGTLAGAIVTGFVLVPVLGLRGSFHIAIALNIIAGIWLLWVSDLSSRRVFAGVSAIALCVLVAAVPAWNQASFSHGSFRSHGSPPTSWEEYKRLCLRYKVIYRAQDGVASVAVLEFRDAGGGRAERALMIDGKADASAFGDMPTQVLMGQLPMLLKPDARDVLVVGLGSGATSGSVLTHPESRVDCVEISPAVAKATRCFDHVNHRVLENPRLKLIVEDARTFVAATPKKYDVVINEPSNPWVAGEGNLFSIDYFESINRAMKPHGLLVQWFHTYEISDDLVAMIVRTLRQVFPYTCLFQGAANDFIIVAAREPISPDFASMEARIRLRSVRDDLDRISVDSVAAILGRQLLSTERLARLGGKGAINSDDRPLLEFSAPRAQLIGAQADSIASSDQRLDGSDGLMLDQYCRMRPLDRPECRSLIRAYSDRRMLDRRLRLKYVQYYVRHWPDEWSLGLYSRLTHRGHSGM